MITITVNRVGEMMGDVNATVDVIDVTATEYDDYELLDDVIHFFDGQASTVISIKIINDDEQEENEVMFYYNMLRGCHVDNVYMQRSCSN